MKSAIYINEGTTQVVLTPENEWEKSALKMIANSSGQESQVYWDKFYDCQGGWYRQGQAIYSGYGEDRLADDTSLMFRINKKMPDPPAQVFEGPLS
jgi:hypothetical protein